MIKTHYYGGIKKYHWVNVPLSLHGVAYTKEGKRIDFKLGEKENEPKFIIPDVLPHLAKNQMKKEGSSIIEGEDLNIVAGNMPINDEKIKEQIKFTVLKFLFDNYGLIEEDFNIAELQLVPATKAVDIGVDNSMIAGYGQDDRVCAFTELKAILDIKKNEKTAVAMFVDKEEIGSMGNTGAASNVLKIFTEEYIDLLKLKEKEDKILENSNALSGDVTCGMNPNYKDVNDSKNVSFLSFGVSIEKYGGGGGKYSTNDAHAEYMQYLRVLANKENIRWQTGELGKIDIGGGGTIAMYISKYGLDCVDAGPPVLGMHSPCELTSKVDIFETYRLYKAFFQDV
jgi:aspartyl aminopeptidase